MKDEGAWDHDGPGEGGEKWAECWHILKVLLLEFAIIIKWGDSFLWKIDHYRLNAY